MKRSPLKRRKPLKKGKGLRKMSKQRAIDSVAYFRLRDAYLKQHEVCEICRESKPQECHHRKGRGKWYLAVETFMALCKRCHRRVHREVAWSQKNGFLIPFHLH